MSEPTPTPRTDNLTYVANEFRTSEKVVPAAFAAQLETELIAALVERDRLRQSGENLAACASLIHTQPSAKHDEEFEDALDDWEKARGSAMDRKAPK